MLAFRSIRLRLRAYQSTSTAITATRAIAKRSINSSGSSGRSSSNSSRTKTASASALLLVAAPPLAMAAYSVTVAKRPGLDSAPDDAAAKSHHVRSRHGATTGFQNPHPSNGDGVGFFTIMRKMIRLFIRGESITFPQPTPETIPAVHKPTFLPGRHASPNLRATWLGHACHYVEYPSGLRVLFDPVFEDRCSPFSFLGPKRLTPRPCSIADLPIVDAVVISHSHYDHLSTGTVAEIREHHPEAHFFVGLGLERWFRKAGVEKVTELDWWEDADLTLTPRTGSGADGGEQQTITARISCLPCQHSSGRTGLDRDETLWCSWGVSSSSASSPTARSVYFGGDTGYRAVPHVTRGVDDWGPEYTHLPICPQFAQIGQHRGPFDLGLIPIGAYAPRFVFSPMHTNPFDAVEIFRDTRCRRAVGIHWGTWALTAEPLLEPPAMLRTAMERKGMPQTGVFDTCEIGESIEI